MTMYMDLQEWKDAKKATDRKDLIQRAMLTELNHLEWILEGSSYKNQCAICNWNNYESVIDVKDCTNCTNGKILDKSELTDMFKQILIQVNRVEKFLGWQSEYDPNNHPFLDYATYK